MILHVTYTAYNYQGAYNWTYYTDTVSLHFGESISLYDDVQNHGEGPYDLWGVEFVYDYDWWEFIGSTGGGGGGGSGGSGGVVAGLEIQFSNENPRNLVIGSDPDATDSLLFFNRANTFLTLRPRNQSGQLIGGDVQWRIFDTVSDTLFQDWVTSTEIYLWDLNERSYLVESRPIGGSTTYSGFFSFSQTNLTPSASNGFIIRDPDNIYPYRQQRWSSCGIVSFRNLLHILGKQVPTEDEIIQELVNVGVGASKWYSTPDTPGAGMSSSETNTYANVVLSPRGVTLTHNQNITKAQFEASLNNGSVHFVGIKINDWDNDEQNGLQPAGHAVVMRKSGNKVEIIDPSSGRSNKVSVEKAMSMIQWGGDPQMTGNIWTATAP